MSILQVVHESRDVISIKGVITVRMILAVGPI